MINKLNYVDEAARVMKQLTDKAKERGAKQSATLTTSKIRNLLSMVTELRTDAQHAAGNELDDDLVSRVQYFKMRLAYEEGREPAVKDFAKQAGLMELVAGIGRDKQQLLLFCNYMEALVAYHRFYGGKDN